MICNRIVGRYATTHMNLTFRNSRTPADSMYGTESVIDICVRCIVRRVFAEIAMDMAIMEPVEEDPFVRKANDDVDCNHRDNTVIKPPRGYMSQRIELKLIRYIGRKDGDQLLMQPILINR